MGYHLSQLKNLPVGFDWYFFVLGEVRNHSMINNFFREDFSIISEVIGSDSAIIAQSEKLEDDFQSVLNDWYFSFEHGSGEYSKKKELVSALEKLRTRSPGLIIMDKHPYEFDIDRDRFLYIPFIAIEKSYVSTNAILEDLVAFAKNENDNLVKKTVDKSFWRRIKPSISLGIGVISINFSLK